MPETLQFDVDNDADILDLTCPGCGADLLIDPGYTDWRLCSGCNRHFWISARERLQMLQRDAVFTELDYPEATSDVLDRHTRFSPRDRQDDVRERSALADALVTGYLSLPGCSAVVAILDSVLMPAGLGIVTTEKLIGATRQAIADRLPMVVFCGGGSLPAGAGILTSAQPLRLAAAISDLHRAGLPLIAIMTHPSAGNVLAAIASNADLRLSEPGTDLVSDVAADESVSRPELLERLTTMLLVAAGHEADLDIELAESRHGATVRVRPLVDVAVVSLDFNTDECSDDEIARAARRGKRIAVHLDVPIVVSISGNRAFSITTQADLRDLLVRHRRPIVGVMTGSFTMDNYAILAADCVLAGTDLAVSSGPRSRPFTAADALAAGLVDAILDGDPDTDCRSAIDTSLRLGAARRMERRLRVMGSRGAEAADSREASTRELVDLRELQGALMRSLDDFRHRVEAREFSLPSFAQLQGRVELPHVSLPKLQITRPDLDDVRERISALRKGTGGHQSGGDTP